MRVHRCIRFSYMNKRKNDTWSGQSSRPKQMSAKECTYAPALSLTRKIRLVKHSVAGAFLPLAMAPAKSCREYATGAR